MNGCSSHTVIAPGQKAATHEVSERSGRGADCWPGEVTGVWTVANVEYIRSFLANHTFDKCHIYDIIKIPFFLRATCMSHRKIVLWQKNEMVDTRL